MVYYIVKKFIERLIQLYPSFGDTIYVNNPIAKYMDIVGNALICITFIIIGMLCFKLASKITTEPGRIHRVRMTRTVGSFIFGCGISRAMHVLAFWYNFALINSYLQIFVGAIAAGTIIMTPYYLKSILRSPTLDEVKKSMEDTSAKVDALTNLSKKVIERK